MRPRARRFGKRLLLSDRFQSVAATVVHTFLSFVYRSNRFVTASDDLSVGLEPNMPAILALWHGQQFLVPYCKPDWYQVAAIVSRSSDAEINARVLQRAGVGVIRGSGGRDRGREQQKGGIRALKAMASSLARGTTVVMIADISKGTPREAGLGIVTLAKLTGRPIVPFAVATSRHRIVEKSWDKTTINLPFGRKCIKLGEPIYVPRNASAAELENCRQRVTDELNSATENAYQAVRNRV